MHGLSPRLGAPLCRLRRGTARLGVAQHPQRADLGAGTRGAEIHRSGSVAGSRSLASSLSVALASKFTGSFAVALSIVFAPALIACSPPAAAPAADDGKAEAEKAKKEEEDRLEKRKQERLAADKAKEDEAAAIKAKIAEVTVIPEGTKLPKKVADACAQVVTAQTEFMKRHHPDTEESAVATQTGMLGKQCNEMGDISVAMCQKFALDATDDLLKSSINEYLPVCMEKYGKKE